MKKQLYLLLFLVFLVAGSQQTHGQHRKSLKQYSAGMTLGANMTNISLSDECYSIYGRQWIPHPVVGAFFQYRSKDGYSIRPEINYYGRGGGFACQDVSYRLSSHCLSLQLGLRLDCIVPRSFVTFYGMVAPELTVTLGGSVEYSSKNTSEIEMHLSSSNVRPLDFGALCGIGVEFPLFFGQKAVYLSGEAGYRFHFVNSFTAQEQSGDITILNYVNMPPLARGSRMCGGAEVTIRIGIPFGNTIRIRRL